MILVLRLFFTGVLIVMFWVTVRASLEVPLWGLSGELTSDLWFQATLVDAYFGFLTFWIWVCYKENNAIRSGLWLVALLIVGNFAIAAYCLRELFRVSRHAGVEDVLLRRKEEA